MPDSYTPTIAKILREEEQLTCTRAGVAKFLKRFEETVSLSRRSGSGHPSKITADIKEIVRCNTTMKQLPYSCIVC